MSEHPADGSEQATAGAGDDGFSLTAEQDTALALGHNVAITAGAGTGKTTTLKERYREILTEHPDIDPTEILTLTFTNDATSEMRERIREVVDEELAAGGEYERWRRARDDLEDAYVHTIHGFCSRILREFAVESGVHPEFETLDEGDASALAEEATTAVLDRHGGVAGPVGSASADTTPPDRTTSAEETAVEWDLETELRRLSRQYSRSSLEDALSSLFGERPDSVEWAREWAPQSPEAYVEHLSSFVETSITPAEADDLLQRDRTREAVETLRRLGDRDLGVPDDDSGRQSLERLVALLEETGVGDADATARGRQRFLLAVADVVTTNSDTLQSQTWRYAGSKATWRDHGHGDERAALADALDALAAVIDPEERNLDHDPDVARRGARQALALARVFLAVRSEYRALKRRRNALDYSDLVTRTIDFLDGDDAVRRELRDQFAHIMVDEVQDTDPRQWRLVTLLSGDDPDRFDGRNVFVVGDEKQSIYRFRSADVTQFREAREQLVADNPPEVDGNLELTANFRTVDPTLEVVNELFERVLQPAESNPFADDDAGDGTDEGPPQGTPAREAYEAAPQRLRTCRQEGTDIEGQVEYLVVPESEDGDEALGLADSWYTEERFADRAEREARALAARLARLFAESEVYDPEAGERVPAEPRHVALLFRSSRRVAAFERAFTDAGIPYTNLAGGGFYDTPEVRPLVSLLRVLEDPRADAPLYGVLRSPLFGFPDGDIVRARDPDGPLWDSLTAADPDLRAARERIEAWRTAVGLGDDPQVERWSTLVSRVIGETGYLVGVGADERGRQAVANVEKFRARIRRWEAASAQSAADLLDRIEQARERETAPGEATVPGDIEGVQLRTIHSAKGLEFPVVVVPELTRKFNMRSSISGAHFERIDGDPLLGMKAPASERSHDTTHTAAYLAVRERHRRRERAEQRRLLYVAATRTRDHLLLSGTHGVDPGTDSGLAPPGDWAEADRWTDWVQPALLDRSGLVDRLADEGAVEATIGSAPYTVRRPTPPGDWSSPESERTVPSDIEIPAPARSPPRVRLSATTFRDRLDGAPDRPAALRATDDTTGASIDDEAAIGALGDDDVGTVVHRLCELAPPREEWRDVARRCVDDPGRLTDEAFAALAAHAEAGLDGLQRLEQRHEVESRHAELSVTAELPSARVVGDIDHLSVTDEGYLVVDYKTSDLQSQSIAALTEHYLPQLLAYAGALAGNDPDAERFELALVFTDTGETRRRSLSRAEVDELLGWADKHLATSD